MELKYAKYKDPESRVEELRLEAIAQACLLYTSVNALTQPLLTLNLILWKTHCKGTDFCDISKLSKKNSMFYNTF